MAFLAPLAPFLSAVGAGVSIATGIRSLVSKPKAQDSAPTPPPVPEKPTIEQAQETAVDQVKKRRRISLLTGGRTNITRGQALVPESSVEKKSLIGV